MSLYGPLDEAMRERDAEKLLGLLHDDHRFVSHRSGRTLDKSASAEMIRGLMSNEAAAVRDLRCLYENDEIMVTHAVMDFPDGTREAVLEFTTSGTARSSAQKPAPLCCPSSSQPARAVGAGPARASAHKPVLDADRVHTRSAYLCLT
jgi:hypothetical protein